ncbi:hypothetical protein NCAS_0B04730 [Naumovozyma castellii]|uniref:USP domain-containing protein n=1 Tax=Naumovozyma castellii TaxID=27288 RepID=G0VAN1_NAUCA|nr:hypothetical protein NCAS_0B04730 [Naumovozyma castellii CBS 4309]CCC68557.1 hypothetical protein NCAS_0B04730 [Naumovozyma castellii CBS 4309]
MLPLHKRKHDKNIERIDYETTTVKRVKRDRSISADSDIGRFHSLVSTINLKKLNFDFKKVCSVTLSPTHVYCCLVCGKYFQGRNERSPAFVHSIDSKHHIFINMNSLEYFELPENIQIEAVDDKILKVIRYAICPTYSNDAIKEFPLECIDTYGKVYANGFIGVTDSSNNHSAFINVVLMLIGHINPIRNFFLLTDLQGENLLLQKLSILMRKIWSPHLIRNYICTDEFLDFLVINKQLQKLPKDPKIFLLWLINNLAIKSKILKQQLMLHCQGKIVIKMNNKKTIPFWNLTLDLPVFRSDFNAVPQVKIGDLLKKYDDEDSEKYTLKQLPHFLILHFNRFDAKSEFPIKNRNQTLVEFNELLTIRNTNYKLISNIIHSVKRASDVSSEPNKKDDISLWKIQVYNNNINKWFEVDGSTIKEKNPEFLFINETYLQIWEKSS